jgi:hypothetical protein
VDPDPAEYTRVVTPAAGRTLKCLYASAIGAPLVTPAWVKESVKALKALSARAAHRRDPSSAAGATTDGATAGKDPTEETAALGSSPVSRWRSRGTMGSTSNSALY